MYLFPVHLKFAYGQCHALTAALFALAPAGEAFGLFVDGECIHSVFRVPHTEIYLDAIGADEGFTALSLKAIPYVRSGDRCEWRPLDEQTVRSWATVGGDTRNIKTARSLAFALLRRPSRVLPPIYDEPAVGARN